MFLFQISTFFTLPSSGYPPPDDRHHHLQTGVTNLRPVALTRPTFFTTPSTSPPPSPLHHQAVERNLHRHPYTLISTPRTLKVWAMADPILLSYTPLPLHCQLKFLLFSVARNKTFLRKKNLGASYPFLAPSQVSPKQQCKQSCGLFYHSYRILAGRTKVNLENQSGWIASGSKT